MSYAIDSPVWPAASSAFKRSFVSSAAPGDWADSSEAVAGADRAPGADRNLGADGDRGADRAALCQAPGSDRSPAGAGIPERLGGEIRGGGAVLESTGSFTAYRGRRKPLTRRMSSTTVRIGSSRRGRNRNSTKRVIQRDMAALSHLRDIQPTSPY